MKGGLALHCCHGFAVQQDYILLAFRLDLSFFCPCGGGGGSFNTSP
jgi:hypothetical protein